MHTRYMLAALLALSACSEFDMQGHDPKDYYARNPIENRVEDRSITIEAQFEAQESRLSSPEVARVRNDIHGISPHAVDAIHVMMHPSQLYNNARRTHISKLLRSMGYQAKQIGFESSDSVDRDAIQIVVDYAAVVSPHCPDYRTSGITTYSNTQQGGYSCASVTNLGLQIADPRDLVKGSGPALADPIRNSKVLQEYRNNKDYNNSDSSGGSTSSTTP